MGRSGATASAEGGPSAAAEASFALFADEEGGQPAAEAFAFSKFPERGEGAHKAAILIGPEGGFDHAEREAIRAHPQARPISLGPRILRGETAALAAVALWMGLAGDWETPC